MGIVKNRKAECHPDQKHFAHGKCYKCYKHAYHRKNAAKHCKRSRDHYIKNREAKLRYQKSYTLKSAYGITLDDYEQMLSAQGGMCAICGQPPNPTPARRKPRIRPDRQLVVDHDHRTGRVRGLLCNKCNTGLWGLEDESWRLKAEAYLED